MTNRGSHKPNEGQKRFGSRPISPTQPEWDSRPEKARSKDSEARKAELERRVRDGVNRRYEMRPIREQDQADDELTEEAEAA